MYTLHVVVLIYYAESPPPTPPPRFYPSDSAPSTSTPAQHTLIVPLRLHPLCFCLSDSAPSLLPLRLCPLCIFPSALSDFPPLTPAPFASTPPTRPLFILPLQLHPLAFIPLTPPPPHLPLRLSPPPYCAKGHNYD
jgi:hypothetical protein